MEHGRPLAIAAVVAWSAAIAAQAPVPGRRRCRRTAPARPPPQLPAEAVAASQQVITETCVGCHSDRAKAGGLSLQGYAVTSRRRTPRPPRR